MRTLILVTLLLLVHTVSGQVEFDENIVIDDTNLLRSVRSLVLIDIDGDGDDDLLSTAINNDFISWFENIDGQGTFGDQNIISQSLNAPFALLAADVDNDGDNDVIATSSFGSDQDKLVWFENLDGSGSFGELQLISSIFGLNTSIAANDIDDDGDIDIIVGEGLSLNWFKNEDGLGNFSSPLMISGDIEVVRSVFIADINGDGDNDVVAASYNDDEIMWFENLDGLGNFSSKNTIAVGINGAISVFVADFDNDDDLDVVSASGLDDKIVWFENLDGLGSFGDLKTVTNSFNGPHALSVNDIDNDGDIDIVASSTLDNKITWFENQTIDGDIDFSNSYDIALNIDSVQPIVSSDINGDGTIDIVAASVDSDYIVWYSNTNGTGDFEQQNFISIYAEIIRRITSGDLDGDGDIDLISTQQVAGRIMWYENIDSEGEYAPRILATEIEDVFSVTTGDIDNDGDVDVLSGSISDTNIIWYENVNNGLLFIKHLISNDDEGSTESVVLVDLDNDNDLDVVCPVGSKIYWYENEDAQGNFSDKKVVVNFINAKSIVAVDLDGDGDKDIVAGSTVEVEINWYENINNSDSFIEREIDTIDAQSINCEDYDLDGDLDLMTADYEGNRIVFYENLDGLGNFGVEEVISSQVENPVQIYSADLDSDGDKDIISASIGDDKVAWYENNGEGGFGSQNIILVDSSNTPRNVSAAFIDSDNDIDVIVSFSKFDEGEKILWFSNLITLNIVESVTDNINSYPNPVSNILHFNSELNISQIKVFNELGKKIKENTNSNTIDLSSLVEGIYFIKIVDVEGSQATQKIIKS